MPKFDERLKCEVSSLSYDFDMKRGTIDLAEWHSADAEGTLAIFSAIDAEVQAIAITAAGRPDTLDSKVNGQWQTNLLG